MCFILRRVRLEACADCLHSIHGGDELIPSKLFDTHLPRTTLEVLRRDGIANRAIREVPPRLGARRRHADVIAVAITSEKNVTVATCNLDIGYAVKERRDLSTSLEADAPLLHELAHLEAALHEDARLHLPRVGRIGDNLAIAARLIEAAKNVASHHEPRLAAFLSSVFKRSNHIDRAKIASRDFSPRLRITARRPRREQL